MQLFQSVSLVFHVLGESEVCSGFQISKFLSVVCQISQEVLMSEIQYMHFQAEDHLLKRQQKHKR